MGRALGKKGIKQAMRNLKAMEEQKAQAVRLPTAKFQINFICGGKGFAFFSAKETVREALDDFADNIFDWMRITKVYKVEDNGLREVDVHGNHGTFVPFPED